MTEDEKQQRLKQLNHGVREDGTIEGYVVETYLSTVYAIECPQQYGFNVDHENRFIAFTIDAGGTDEEVRLPFEIVEQFAQWMKNKPAPNAT